MPVFCLRRQMSAVLGSLRGAFQLVFENFHFKKRGPKFSESFRKFSKTYENFVEVFISMLLQLMGIFFAIAEFHTLTHKPQVACNTPKSSM